MRKRPLIVLSTVAAATLLLAGCSGGCGSGARRTPDASASELVPGGSEVRRRIRRGRRRGLRRRRQGHRAGRRRPDRGSSAPSSSKAMATTSSPATSSRCAISSSMRTTNEVLSTSERGPDGVLSALLAVQQPQQMVDPTQSTVFTVAAECVPIGSQRRADSSRPRRRGRNPSVLYIETIEELPTIASGYRGRSDRGDAEGRARRRRRRRPSRSPTTDAPTETEVAVLKQGDGAPSARATSSSCSTAG